MIHMNACKNGKEVEIWGSFESLNRLYNMIGSFWNDDSIKVDTDTYESRDKTINDFSYEIRKTFSGDRLRKNNSRDPEYFGCRLSWVNILFSLSALRYNMRSKETTKLDIAVFLELEYWLEESMKDFDKEGFSMLCAYIDGGIYAGNPYLYQYMRSIDIEAKKSAKGKKALRLLPQLLRRAVYGTTEYEAYEMYLKSEAKRHDCNISDLDFND